MMSHKKLFGIDTQKLILERAIQLAGDRYTEDLHIPTVAPISKINIATHDESYKESIETIYKDIISLSVQSFIKDIAEDNLAIVIHSISNFIDNYPLTSFDWNDCRLAIKYVQDICYEKLRSLNNSSEQKNIIKRASIRDLTNLLNRVEDLISEDYQNLYNSKLAILYGEGGIGKTHLLCDYAKRRLESELPTMLFLSDSLASTDPVLAIARQLGLKSKRHFLKGLEQTVEQYGQMCIIVDAINENPNMKWRKIVELLSVPTVSIILSVRSGFEAAAKVDGWAVPRIEHLGFADGDLEWDAMQKYFQHYNLTDIADTPILYEEFRNPLFLKIFCESYNGSRVIKKPRGNIMTNIFEQYVAKKTDIISRDLGVKIGKKDIWNGIVKKIASTLGHKGIKPTISHRSLERIIKSSGITTSSCGNIISLLCNNGILRKVPHYTKLNRRLGFDYEFVYHKFSDHIIVRYFLNSFSDMQKEDATAKISKSPLLQNALKEWNTGLIEALAIQYPERYDGHELIEIIPSRYKFSRTVWPAVLDSIVWRDPKTFTSHGEEVLKQYIMDCNRKEDILLDYLDRLLSVAIIPEHPFNALKLHFMLSRNPMPRRDTWWQEYTCYSGRGGDAFARLCSWAFSGFGTATSDDQKFLAALTLAWFTASSDKGVRDRASYAILNLVGDNLKIIYGLLRELKNCDDQYVLERLYLISYSVTIHAHDDKKSFKKIVDFIDKVVFSNKERAPNIIVDQCAKDIVELYQSRYGDVDNRIITRAMPPYDYHNPLKRLPSIETITNKYGHETARNDCRTIISSVMYPDALADFGNYTMGGCLHNLSSVPLSESIPVVIQQYNDFLSSLTRTQEEILWEYRSILRDSVPTRMPAIHILGDKQDSLAIKHKVCPATATKADVRLAKEVFMDTLSESQREQLKKVGDYIFSNKNPNTYYHNRRYNLLRARRWVFKNVLRLGWSYDLHGGFDAACYRYSHMRGDSDIARIERIGKKYQWISLHQLMALASSRYYLLDNYRGCQLSRYADSLSFNDRRFDPTVPPNWVIDSNGQLLGDSEAKSSQDKQFVWWQPNHQILDDDKWLFFTHDIPTIEQLVCIQYDNKEYLALRNWPTWKKYYDNKTKWRELWMQVNSYIVKLDDVPKIDQLCQGGTFSPMRWELPNSELHDNLFLGEILHNTPLVSTDFESMTKLLPPNKKRPFSVAATTLEYNGGSFELGQVMRQRIQMPSPFLRKQLGLSVNKHMGFTNSNDLEIFCPTISSYSSNNQHILVADKDIIGRLHKHGYTIMWTVTGEKQEFNNLPPNKDSICLRGCMYIDKKKKIVKKVRFNKISNEYKKKNG